MTTAWQKELGVVYELLVGKGSPIGSAVLAFIAILFAGLLSAGAGAQSPTLLTPKQEEIAYHVEGMLMAPCCFANTVAEHRSPISDQIREEVRGLAAKGATETEILDLFVDKYGERILAAPRPQGFNLAAYFMPVVALAAGLFAIGFILRRLRRSIVEPSIGPPNGANAKQLKARFEDELAQFDA